MKYEQFSKAFINREEMDKFFEEKGDTVKVRHISKADESDVERLKGRYNLIADESWLITYEILDAMPFVGRSDNWGNRGNFGKFGY